MLYLTTIFADALLVEHEPTTRVVVLGGYGIHGISYKLRVGTQGSIVCWTFVGMFCFQTFEGALLDWRFF